MKLQLPELTLVMIDVQCPDLAWLAIADSMRGIDFGDAVVFSDTDLAMPGTRWVMVPKWPSSPSAASFSGTNCPNTSQPAG